MTLGATYQSRTPNLFEDMFSASKSTVVESTGFVMLAPMWTDANAKEGHVFYQAYTQATAGLSDDAKARTERVMAKAIVDVKSLGGPSDFRPTWVLVVTWENLLPRVSYEAENDKVIIMCFNTRLNDTKF